MPASRGFTVLLAALYIAGGFLAGGVLDEPEYAQRAMMAITVQFTSIILLLQLKGFRDRTQQTIGALSGTGFLFGLMSIYLLSLVNVEKPQVELAALYFVLFIWSIAVDGHIYRHALSSKIGTGVLVAVTIFSINFILLRTFFG
ncbi:MAG: hypothetical protein V2I48_00600 [Xanthomonadales bacterium]|nr:hypothetical protein [Xanthomonadales bacterium]